MILGLPVIQVCVLYLPISCIVGTGVSRCHGVVVPPYVLICSGNPCVVNILSTCGTTATALVLFTNSTSGYLEYSSTMTITCSPLGSGPQRSMSSSAKVSQVEDSVSGGICLGCKWWLGRRDILQPSSQPSCPGRGTIIWIVVAACISQLPDVPDELGQLWFHVGYLIVVWIQLLILPVCHRAESFLVLVRVLERHVYMVWDLGHCQCILSVWLWSVSAFQGLALKLAE